MATVAAAPVERHDVPPSPQQQAVNPWYQLRSNDVSTCSFFSPLYGAQISNKII